MATLVTEICNQALSRIGAKRLAYSGTTETDLDANTTIEAIRCNLNYAHTRDMLLRSNWWGFARKRVVLRRDTETPAFEYSYQYDLPADYLRMISVYENQMSDQNLYSYIIEGTKLLTDETTVSIRYVRKVTDVTEFDPLFTEVLILTLAVKLLPALAGTKTPQFSEELRKDLSEVISQARTINGQETNTIGQYELETWNDARY